MLRYLVIFLIFSVSCSSEADFDSQKWKEKGVDWELNDTREKMVNNLVNSDTLIGLRESDIIKLLGKPEISGSQKFKFIVRTRYKWNIDPEYIKYLWVEFDTTGKATKCYLETTK